mgnify:FL=1|tara:strand:- start:301 stop:678 length:378 start_codon:yes stop_codon:yes gene_type:complete
MEKKIVSDKSQLFVSKESEPQYIRVSADSDEHLKVWVKQPTWLQVEMAMAAVMKVDPKTQSMDIDMNAMYRFMVENFIEKTEPSLSIIDILRLNPYVGNQLKEILPNPMDSFKEDEVKNEQFGGQ